MNQGMMMYDVLLQQHWPGMGRGVFNMTRPPRLTIPCSARWGWTSGTRSQKSSYVGCMVKYQAVEMFHYTVWCKSPHVRTQSGDIFFWMIRHVFLHQVRQEHTGARARTHRHTQSISSSLLLAYGSRVAIQMPLSRHMLKALK